MKKYIKKLFYSSVIALMSLGINFKTEARVTKEVAEAVLPYLMEAAGIPGDPDEEGVVLAKEAKYKNVKIKAILDMIYTDEGQQQMVKWVRYGKFPDILKGTGDAPIFRSENTYADEAYRKVSLASLFPCQTGTFTSFTNHKSRLGSYILSNPRATDEEKSLKNILSFFESANSAETIISNINQASNRLPTEVLLTKVIFVIDICDSLQQINKLLALKLDKCVAKAEYLCRPVSAIAALDGKNYEGDCVETLYRHLINIAIQDIENLSTFHTEQLCDSLYAYYCPSYKAGNEKESITLESISESGLTSIARHTEWKKHLKETIGEYCSSVGSVNNLARGLSKIASIEMGGNDETVIKNALSSLSKDKSFEVKVEGRTGELPDWVTKTITITEKQSGTLKRTIIVGVNEALKTTSEGHAEILSIRQQ